MSASKGKFSLSFLWRVLIYIAGLFCISMGVSISKNAALGISPVNSLPFVVSGIIANTKASTSTMLNASFFISAYSTC